MQHSYTALQILDLNDIGWTSRIWLEIFHGEEHSQIEQPISMKGHSLPTLGFMKQS